MRRSTSSLFWGLAIVLVAVLSFATGVWVTLFGLSQGIQLPFVQPAPTPTPVRTPVTYLAEEDVAEEIQEEFLVFWQIWSLLEDHFYDPSRIDHQNMIYGATRGMVESLGDHYTYFSTPAQTDVAATHLEREYEGIGAYIGVEDNFPVIQGPISDDTPAARAGLRQGDIVLSVDGVDVEGMPLEEVIARIKGPAGTDVTLTIFRPGYDVPFDVTITRARIEVASVEGEMRDDGLAYVRLAVFGASTAQEMDTVLEELLRKDPQGLILDLRGNGGGFLMAAQEVLGRFVREEVATYQRDRDGNLAPYQVIRSKVRVYDLPMVVLVNGGSASASEIVAGNLQDTGRATLIGEQTFGKGSIQHVFDMPDGSSVRITVAHWLTPNLRIIQDEGLTPDIIVPLTPEDYQAELDPQLDAAAAYLLGHPLPESAVTPTPGP